MKLTTMENDLLHPAIWTHEMQQNFLVIRLCDGGTVVNY